MNIARVILSFFVISLLLFTAVVPSNTGFASASPTDSWIHTYGGASKDRAENLIQTSDGGYVIVGETNATSSGRLQLWLLKIDSQGSMEWRRTYGASGNVRGSCVIQTSDGGYAIAGTANSVAELVKTDAAGNMEWSRSYQDYSWAYCVIQIGDGGYVLAGATGDSYWSSVDTTVWLAKIDPSGNTVWSKTYAEAGLGSANSVVQTNDGGYALVGTTYEEDFLLVKTDANGNFEWSKTYGSPDKDGGSSIVQDADGSYVMAGLLWNRTTFSSGSVGVGLVKADSGGDLLWLKNYPGSGVPSSMIRALDGNYVLCSGMLDKIDTQGNLLWSQNVTFDGNLGGDYAVTTSILARTNDGGYAVAGTIQSTPPNPQDMTSYVWIGKLDANGNHSMFIPEFPPIATLIVAVLISLFALALKKRQSQSLDGDKAVSASARLRLLIKQIPLFWEGHEDMNPPLRKDITRAP
jgi:hypothetical protein